MALDTQWRTSDGSAQQCQPSAAGRRRGAGGDAFIGGEVLNGVHAYTADGHTTRWLANLDLLATALRGTQTLYPGHGDPGGLELLAWQRAYLTTYRQAVAELSGGRAILTPAAKAELVARMERFLPTKRLEFLIGVGAEPVAQELAPHAP